jgi:ALG11 mannosyltransferase N-terminus
MSDPSLLRDTIWYIIVWIMLPAWIARLVTFVARNRHCANRLRSRYHDVDSTQQRQRRKVIAFFHPYCSSGGGGERVLWKAIQVLGDLVEKRGLNLYFVIYTIDAPSPNYKKGQCRR